MLGTNGSAVTDVGGPDTAHALGLQADGSIITVGQVGYGYQIALTRHDAEGELIRPSATGAWFSTTSAHSKMRRTS